MYGRIASHWRRENGRFHLDVTIPPNATATVYESASDQSSVTAKSGTYSFSAAAL